MARPLDPYIESLRPEERPRFAAQSSANWRGHVATWRIADRQLLLLGLTGSILVDEPPGRTPTMADPRAWWSMPVEDASLARCFAGLTPPVRATWFTGWLRCPEGRNLWLVNRGFSSVWEWDRWIYVEQGTVRRERVVENYPHTMMASVDRPPPRARPRPLLLRRGL